MAIITQKIVASEVEKAWLAGLVDGEGSFTMPWKKSSVRDWKYFRTPYTPDVQFTMELTHKEHWENKVRDVLTHLQVPFTFYIWKRKICNPLDDSAVMGRFRVGNWSHVHKLATELLPYLTVKKEVAKIFIDFNNGRPRFYTRTIDKDWIIQTVNWDSLKYMLQIWESIRKLNGHKRKTKVTSEQILEAFKEADGKRFPNSLYGVANVIRAESDVLEKHHREVLQFP